MADYITIDNRQYRVSHNFSALSMFAELTGRRTLDQMSNMEGMSPQDLLTMMYCSIYNGEQLEGRTLEIESPVKLGLLVDIGTMQTYVGIFAKQMNSGLKKDRVEMGDEVKKKTSFWRRLRGKH